MVLLFFTFNPASILFSPNTGVLVTDTAKVVIKSGIFATVRDGKNHTNACGR